MSKEITDLGVGYGNPFLPLEYTLRKTGEVVEIIAFEEKEKGARSDEDWVSYIDSKGEEHIKEHLTLSFDFKSTGKMMNLFDKLLETPKFEELPKFDVWESRLFDMTKSFVGKGDCLQDALEKAEAFQKEFLNRFHTEKDEEYENIGIGEVVESIGGVVRLKKFVFTDKKDIVGYQGDNGRWNVGDRAKVYIRRIKPWEEETPAP